MAVGPTLGTGLFIGTGQALAAGGPASILASYIFISFLAYCLTTTLAEIAAYVPSQNGTMITHTYRYGSTHLGFSIAYLRWYTLSMLVPFEITTAMVNLGLWTPGLRVAVRMGIVMSVISGFNMLPEKMFKRSQAFFTGLKLITTIGLMIVTAYIAIRGIPNTPVHGFYYWRKPGPFNQFLYTGNLGRFLGLLVCLLRSTIPFILVPELAVQRAERLEFKPGATVFARPKLDNIVLFVLYTLSALATTLMSPYDEPLLTNHGTGAGYSPYAVGIMKAKIPALRVVATALIFLSSVASGRSFLYMSSRMLCSLAETGHAPALLLARNRWDVPYVSVCVSAAFSSFTYLSMATSSSAVFNFLMFFITTSGYISWLCSSITYLRFRKTVGATGFFPVHQSFVQPFGAYFSLVTSALLIIANIFQIVIPRNPQFNPLNAIPAFAGILVFALMYLGHRFQWVPKPLRSNLEASRAECHGEEAGNQSAERSVELQPPPPPSEAEGSTMATSSPTSS